MPVKYVEEIPEEEMHKSNMLLCWQQSRYQKNENIFLILKTLYISFCHKAWALNFKGVQLLLFAFYCLQFLYHKRNFCSLNKTIYLKGVVKSVTDFNGLMQQNP